MRPGERDDQRPIEEYRDDLVRFVRLRIGSRLSAKLDASDVVQQAILLAHERCDQFRGATEGERAAWLHAIAENTLAAAVRRFDAQSRNLGRERVLQAELERSGTGLERLLAADLTSPSERAAHGEDLLRLARALVFLPEDQRLAVELHYLEDLSVAQVAERLGRSRPAAVGLLFRGLKRLRELMRDRGGPPHAT